MSDHATKKGRPTKYAALPLMEPGQKVFFSTDGVDAAYRRIASAARYHLKTHPDRQMKLEPEWDSDPIGVWITRTQ